MIEIVVWGRGGQGVVKAAELLATAAFFSGYEVQAFPMFGVERRGSPAQAFVRIDKKPIRTKTQVKRADFAIILDSTLLNSRINAKERIVNSNKKIPSYRSFDADAVALKTFPQAVNTAMISALASFTGLVKKEDLVKACKELFKDNTIQKNIDVIEMVYSKVKNG